MQIQQNQNIQDSKESFDYTTLIGNQHPFHSLLSRILKQLATLLTPQSDPQPNNPTNPVPFPLKIYTTLSQSKKLNCFLYVYTLPVDLISFIKYSQDVKLQKQIDSNIDTYHVLRNIDETTKVMYLAYKKVLFISGRDFIYARYSAALTKDGLKFGQDMINSEGKVLEYLIVSVSLPGQDQRAGVTRGRIVRSILRARQSEGKTTIQAFSQVDMKMQMKPQSSKPKGILQIKRYALKCHNKYCLNQK